MNLSDEQKTEAKQNYEETLRVNRRSFLTTLPAAAIASGAGLGAAYFGYKAIEDPLRVGIIGTGDEGNVLIGALNPEFIDVKAICDIRPSSVWRAFNGDWPSSKLQPARPGLLNVYGKQKGWKTEADARKDVKVYENGYDELLADDDIEAVIIALPLWLHAAAAIDAMLAGKHVLTEKLMAHSVGECKEMARVSESTGKLLATGHQRHYSVLYANAVDTIQQGVLGDIHSIRAQWHRTADTWRPPMPEPEFTYREYDLGVRALRKEMEEAEATKDAGKIEEAKMKYEAFLEEHGLTGKHKSVAARVDNPKIKGKEHEGWVNCLKQLDMLQKDATVPAAAYGYEKHVLSPSGYTCSPLEELIRWRLWNRTGGGLMAELGSHQLDAAGIFISAQFPGHVKVAPLSVTGVGGRYIYPDNRDIDDHVYCTFEYPGMGYFEDDDPSKPVADASKKVGVVYSSINGNGFGGYGEVVMGTAGTLILENEKDTYLIGGNKKTSVAVDKDAVVDTYETGGGAAVAAQVPTEDVSRGYQEEIEHWAWCIRNGKPPETLHCHPKVAMADAVIALTSNIAMEKKERIEFDPAWFDIKSDEVPGGEKPRQASAIKKSDFGAPQENA